MFKTDDLLYICFSETDYYVDLGMTSSDGDLYP